MQTPVKALVVATTASLVAVLAAAVAGSAPAWLWVAWVALAVVTAGAVVAERRQRA